MQAKEKRSEMRAKSSEEQNVREESVVERLRVLSVEEVQADEALAGGRRASDFETEHAVVEHLNFADAAHLHK